MQKNRYSFNELRLRPLCFIYTPVDTCRSPGLFVCKIFKMEKYLVTIEFRYSDAPRHEEDSRQYVNKIITLGVYDTRDQANISGNKALEVFEMHFKLNPNYNRKERFSNNGGPFGFPNDLISNLAYLQTPFAFYAKITPLKYGDVGEHIINAIEATKRYKKFIDENC